MLGTITKIHELKESRNGNWFMRVEFRLKNGDWAKTDLCPSFRNYERWKYLLKVGVDLTGLNLKRKGEVNADSYPEVRKPNVAGHWEDTPSGGMKFVADDLVDKKVEEVEQKQIMIKGFVDKGNGYFKVAGKQEKYYNVYVNENGYATCDCPAFHYKNEYCKHVKIIKKHLDELAKKKVLEKQTNLF